MPSASESQPSRDEPRKPQPVSKQVGDRAKLGAHYTDHGFVTHSRKGQ